MFCIQLFSVLRIYSLEKEGFDYRFKEIIVDGVEKFEDNNPGVSLERAYLKLENYSWSLLKTYYSVNDSTLIDSFRKMSFQRMRTSLIEEQGLEQIIKQLLKLEGVKSEFKIHFKISEINFFKYPDTLVIYNEAVDIGKEYSDNIGIPEEAINVSNYFYPGNFFDIKFDCYVDFIHKKRMVISQMVGILVIMFIALLVVTFVFIITLINMLEERRLSQLKTDFINNMTHELKTPLSTIAIATKTMGKSSVLDDKEMVASMAEMIGRQNKYLSKQINHLLEVSMWEKGQFEIDKKEFELKPYLQALTEAFRWECKEKNLTLIEEYEGIDDLNVFWDETQINMAIHNILVNGAKYSNGDPVINFRVRKEQELIIEIQDNGIGISKEQQKHIFDKFYRVHTGNIHKVKGLGLGLFYVKQIVESHKGEVFVKSKKKSGSTFTIKIPYNG